jgi:N-acetylated-alpha-linked acidic dipeptidase
MAGSHTLQELVNDVARTVQDPVRGVSLFEAARARALEEAKDEERAEIEKREDLSLEALGSGSDYTAFLDHLTMASLNFGFGGEGEGGIYHSNYDSFDWYTRFSDGEFVYGRALSQVVGTTMMRLANAAILPFNFIDLADTLDRYVAEIEKTREKTKDAPEIDLAPVKASIARLRESGTAYEAALASLQNASTRALEAQPELRSLNRTLYSSERRLAHDEGLPRREWFRHQVYAPGLYTGYGVKTIPGIREGIEQKEWEEAKYYVTVVASALDSLVKQVNEAKTLVGALAN